ncbi:hypothetical protein F0562_018051 [Nyssa sinensis]|uniref:RING-type E3 ubiquitin transferase BRCA1 n=1 Tax=Nyssa sinensis TaxID=561372 RepID=A0A5J4ZAV8_9ASTE|nr:hypothetical protein F0562_018051 [Nyssa sinensis]
MADSSHLERMGRELKCPICLSLLNSAVSLTCNHVFCNSCIEKSMKSASNCPVCKVPYRRREVRPAPHMDNLVSIYKSMEISSGVNIFVSQTAPSTKFSDGESKPEDDKVCGGQGKGRTSQETQENQRRYHQRGSKQSSKLEVKNSNPNTGKPSFPTKKRVQVPQYPPSEETPTRPEKFEGGRGETTKHEPERSSVVLKDKPIRNEKGEPVFSPFFWLREEEDIEKLSQQTNGDYNMDTPPKALSFSDIKDSDDEISSRMTPEEKTQITLSDADYFDSEMFEWTQRACSPELCSSPMKMQVADTDEIQENEGKVILQGATTSGEPRTGITESKVPEQGTDIAEVSLRTLSSPRTINSNSKRGLQRSNKRGRQAGESTRKKTAKRIMGEVGIHVNSQNLAECIMQEKHENNGNPNLKRKTCRRDKKVKFDTSVIEPMPEHVPALSTAAKPLNQGDETLVTALPSSSDQNESNNGILKSKKPGRSSTRIVDQQLRDPLVSSKTKNLDSAKNDVTQNQWKEDLIFQSPSISFPTGRDKNFSDLGVGTRKSETKTITKSKFDRALRCLKKPKISADNISKEKLVDVQDGHNKVSTKKKKILGKSDIRTLDDSSEMEKALPNSNGVVLRKCEAVVNKVQCAFCHSTEDSEASGVMVHYLNGKPATADCHGGSKVIHAHRNCIEWAPNVYFEDDNAINLEAELARSRRIKCCFCDIKGSALGCYEKSCRKSFHVPCAKLVSQCRWDNENFVMLCPLHASSKLPNEISESQVKRKDRCIPRGQPRLHQAQVADKHAVTNSMSCHWNSRGSSEKLVLCCSALTNAEKETISEFERLSGIIVLKNWDSSVTHVIASTDVNGACRRTLKILMGILEGKWILSVEWIKACMKAMEPVDEERYEVNVDIHGIRDGPRLGRLRLLNKQPKLFDGCKFYFIGDFVPSYKGYLHDLVIAAGGTVLHRKPISGEQKALSSGCSTSPTFIIYSLELPDKCDPSKRNLIFNGRRSDAEALASSTGAIAASNSWVLNSIAACKLQNLVE